MANETYIKKFTNVLFNGEAGADVAISVEGLANAAGRVSAQYDLGASPRPYLFTWSCEVQFQATPTQYSGLELYIATAPDHDATQIDGDIGSVFAPLFRLFEQLETGYLDDAAGRPIMREWDGQWCEIAPALLGWADCWQRIADAEGLTMDLEPLRRISRKLKLVSPLTESEVESGRAAMMETHRAFLRLPVGTIKRHANNEEISIALEGMKEAA
jgi:hypothetical protein